MRVGDHLAQQHRFGITYDRRSTIQQQRQQALEAAHDHPVFREQHAEPAFLAIWRAANEDRHRHQAHVAVRMFAHVVKQLSQRFRTRSMLRPTKQARPPRQRDHRAATPDWQVFRRRVRCWQASFGGCLIEDQGVGQTLSFEDVNGRQVARRNQIGGIGWLLPNLQPTAKQRAEHTNMQGRRAPWRGGDRSADWQTRGRVAGLGQRRIHLCAGDGG